MAPLIVQLVSTLLAKIRLPWRDAARIGMVVLFLFTGAAHFGPMKNDFAAMLPPPLTGMMWIIYLTGIFEIAGAIGLLVPRVRRLAAICLAVLLAAMFPANAYAALRDIPFAGEPATPLFFRAPLQLFWMFVLWWSSIARPRAVAAPVSAA